MQGTNQARFPLKPWLLLLTRALPGEGREGDDAEVGVRRAWVR